MMTNQTERKLGAPAPALTDGKCSCNDYGPDRNEKERNPGRLVHRKSKANLEYSAESVCSVPFCMGFILVRDFMKPRQSPVEGSTVALVFSNNTKLLSMSSGGHTRTPQKLPSSTSGLLEESENKQTKGVFAQLTWRRDLK